MLERNIENFIACDSSYGEAEIVLFGAPFDSTVPEHVSAVVPSGTNPMVWKLTALIRTRTFVTAESSIAETSN